jgi:hypothetical protein
MGGRLSLSDRHYSADRRMSRDAEHDLSGVAVLHCSVDMYRCNRLICGEYLSIAAMCLWHVAEGVRHSGLGYSENTCSDHADYCHASFGRQSRDGHVFAEEITSETASVERSNVSILTRATPWQFTVNTLLNQELP